MKIKIAITDSRISTEEERKLTLAGFKVITLPPFSKLSEPVASHTDMLIHKIGAEYISYADYCEEASYVFSDLSFLTMPAGAKFSLTADEVSEKYPNDCKLNALRLGNKLFLKADSASEYLICAAERAGIEIVSTNQGYPACTVLKLNDSAVITADQGMAKILTEHSIRVTTIQNGAIELHPYEYGFIGGAGGVCDGVLYFFGNPEHHPDADKILTAAKNEGLRIVALSNGPLRDLGGILFVEGDIN